MVVNIEYDLDIDEIVYVFLGQHVPYILKCAKKLRPGLETDGLPIELLPGVFGFDRSIM